MTRVFVFGPSDNSHVKKWNSFYYGCAVTSKTLHDKNNSVIDILKRFIQVVLSVRSEKYDVCHVHFASSYGILFRFLLVDYRIAVISVWGTDFNRFFGSVGLRYHLWGRVILWALKRYNFINVPSLDIYTKMVELGVNKKRLILMQYGVDLEAIRNRVAAARVVNIPNRFLSIRNFAELYNVDFIIKGFAGVSADLRFELDVVGMGTDAEKNRVQELVSATGDPRIRYVGFVESEELIGRLIEAEYFVSVPTMDGLSLVCLEALACNCKGIVSDISSYQNELFLNVCEFIDTSRLSEFTDTVEQVILDKKELRLISQDLSEFDIHQNRKKFRQIIGI